MRPTWKRRSIVAMCLIAMATMAPAGTLARPPDPAASAPRPSVVTRSGPMPEARPVRAVNGAAIASAPGASRVREVKAGLPALRATVTPAVKPAAGPNIPDIAAVGPPAPIEATSSGAPAPAQLISNDGLDDADNAFYYCGSSTPCIEPPDPWIAVGSDHVVQAVNSLFRISSRDGSDVADMLPEDLFLLPPSTDGFADPRVMWDSVHGRWVAIQISWECGPSSSSGFIDLAWSMTADPFGDWWVSGLVYDGYLPDYPGLGLTTDKVIVTANVFELPPETIPGNCTDLITSFAGTDILAVDWANLLDDNSSSVDFDGYQTDASYFTWRPATQMPIVNGTGHLVVGIGTADPEVQNVGYARFTGTVAGNNLTIAGLADLTELGIIEAFRDPPDPEDPGGPIGTPSRPVIDGRPTDAIWQSNRLTFVSTYPCTPTGDATERACARVAQLDTATTTPALAQDMLVADNGKDTFVPGVGAALNGTLHVVYSRSSSTAGASSYMAYQRPTDAAHTLSSALKVGDAATYTYAGDRWGDYVGVAQDPHDVNAVWQGAAYTGSDGMWRTAVSQVYTAGATYHPVDPVRLLDTRVANGLIGAFNANVPRSFTVAGRESIPSDAIAVTGNLTVVNHTAAGFVSLSPLPTASPKTSTLNFPLKDIRANNVTISLSPTGTLAAVYKAGAGRTTHLLFDVTGYFTADDTAATYNTAGPVRLLDSRFDNGLSGPFAASTPRSWQIGGRGGIPADAIAVTGNLTVTGQTAAGFVSVSPTPNASPGTSTINFPLGDNRANGITVPLAIDGTLSAVYKAPPGRTTHLIFDVTGYYLDDLSGARFVPLSPGRRLDTRAPIGLAGKFASGIPRNLLVPGYAGVAVDAIAVTGNLTVVNQTAAGYVSITTDEESAPLTSTLNFPKADIRANGVTVPLNPGASIWLVYAAAGAKTTDLILDMTGYFR